MNNKLIYVFVSMLLVFASCQNDDIEYTETGKLAGEWWVTCEAKDASGTWQDLGLGHVPLLTYNTAANKADEMYVDDQGKFWDFKVKASVTAGTLKFGSDAKLENLSYENCQVTLTNGEVLYGVGHSKTGIATDSICFYVQFSDDKDNLTYKVAGHKRTGWTNDEY